MSTRRRRPTRRGRRRRRLHSTSSLEVLMEFNCTPCGRYDNAASCGDNSIVATRRFAETFLTLAHIRNPYTSVHRF
ncbi:hypothetical protein EVAR_34052_1 [Eumeta japonica]|uniref:Uncharacterized protein n=1 Tax=Eumeta variegata TaxID=151549 RepID=A0A4C1VTV5_EUMVA|nr:hypothetical protein EVAR_34052_1 [Eumeta japonica]